MIGREYLKTALIVGKHLTKEEALAAATTQAAIGTVGNHKLAMMNSQQIVDSSRGEISATAAKILRVTAYLGARENIEIEIPKA